MIPFPEGKREPAPETEQIFLAGEYLRVFAITILIMRHIFHYGFGEAFFLISNLTLGQTSNSGV
jgi:hypothetical protein